MEKSYVGKVACSGVSDMKENGTERRKCGWKAGMDRDCVIRHSEDSKKAPGHIRPWGAMLIFLS